MYKSVQSGEVLIEQGDASVPFFVVITGEIEIVHPLGPHETLVTVHGSGEFTERLTCYLQGVESSRLGTCH